MPVVKVKNKQLDISCTQGANLLEVLLQSGVFVDNPCGGKGRCGKCKIKVVQGIVPEASSAEKSLLKKKELEEGIRLSCLVDIYSDIVIEILHKERQHKILTKGYSPEFTKDPFDSGYGVAIDIGTTTVVASLIELKSGTELSNTSMINAQKHYGLDVLTRITYEYENQDTGIEQLQHTIVHSINGMINQICVEAEVLKHNILEIDIGANTTMMHMLLGVDAKPIGRAPYEPIFLDAKELLAKDIGIQAGENTRLYCLPAVSGYIGADIVAGAYVCRLHQKKGNVLFIDIGTNGEMVLACNGRLLCCSCAAGPALEGMNISCGMRAAEGAIEDIVIDDTGLELKIIGGGEGVGLCGSGILSVVKELLRVGIVKKSGVFIKKETLSEADYRYNMIRLNGTKREFIVQQSPEIIVTQGDVRQVQLAKGAILSGFIVLLNKAGITMEQLDMVMIAGQFGAHLPKESLIGVGILPMAVQHKLFYVGNSSKTGAYMALLSQKVKREMESLAKEMEYIELAETENYERIFTDSMNL